MTVDGRIDVITKDMFRQQFTDFVQDLDEMTLCELIIGHAAIGYSSDLGCYVTDLDDPDRIWCGGLTRADTRLILKELRTISCALSASQEDFGEPLEEVGPDMHLAVEYVAATHAMVSILALVTYRRLHEEAESAYESYATRLLIWGPATPS